MPLQAQLDHVVLLVPYKDVVDPPEWLTRHFTISPGGKHADGKTENKLVLFADGTYLEIIAFVDDDPERRRGHWWDKPYGVVDWALTTPNEAFPELPSITERLSRTDTGISYTVPQDGGRVKPDGHQLQWRVTFPTGADRGMVPFWCHDVTPRDRRVPITKPNTTHPSGAIGMGGVLSELQDSSVVARLATATAAILDTDLSYDSRFGLDVPHQVARANKPTVRFRKAGADATRNLSLSLVVQSEHAVPDVRLRIGDGTVSIVFEKPT